MSLTVPNINNYRRGGSETIALASCNKVIVLGILFIQSHLRDVRQYSGKISKSLQRQFNKTDCKRFVKVRRIDEIIAEPLGGAHRDPESIAADLKHSIIKNLKSFENLSKEEVYDHRKAKFLQIGRDRGFTKTSNLDGGGLSYKDSSAQKLVTHLEKNKLIYGGLALIVITSLIVLLF